MRRLLLGFNYPKGIHVLVVCTCTYIHTPYIHVVAPTYLNIETLD